MDEKNLIPRTDNFKITVDYLSGKIFDSSLPANQTINDSILESRKKNIQSNIQIINCAGSDIHFTEFDRAVLNALIAEQAADKTFTTAKIIFRRLGGGRDLTPSMRKAILDSVEKLARVRIVIENTKAVEKGIVDGDGKPKNKNDKSILKGYLFPTESFETKVHGQNIEVIAFSKNALTDKFKQGVIFANAERHNHIITCDQDLLQAPINSNPRNIALNHYIVRRTLSIKGSNELAADNKHVKPLRKIITVDDMLGHCGLADYNKFQKNKLLKTTRKILDYLISKNVISNYHLETIKGTGKIYSIILEF